MLLLVCEIRKAGRRELDFPDFLCSLLKTKGIGQFGELFQIIAAINDARVEEGGGFQFGGRDALPRVLADRQVGPTKSARGDARPTGCGEGVLGRDAALRRPVIAAIYFLDLRRKANRLAAPSPASANVEGSGAGSISRNSGPFNPEISEGLTVAPAVVYSPIVPLSTFAT